MTCIFPTARILFLICWRFAARISAVVAWSIMVRSVISFGTSKSELSLGEVMNEALHRSPLLCRVVEDGYGRSCGFSRLIGGPIVSNLELKPVVHDASNKPPFL
jgi:hypothetical protein